MEGLSSDDSVQWHIIGSEQAIQAAYSQQNCGRGTTNSDFFVVSAVSNLNNIYRGKIQISYPFIQQPPAFTSFSGRLSPENDRVRKFIEIFRKASQFGALKVLKRIPGLVVPDTRPAKGFRDPESPIFESRESGL